MPPGHPRHPDAAASRPRLWRSPSTLVIAAIALGLTIGASRNMASLAGSATPELRPSVGLFSTADVAPPSVALRPRDDLGREARPFILTTRSRAERRRAVQCLANAIYYEAALEPLDGQRAVAQVVLNRVRDVDFPHSICGVVYQGWARMSGCQFSFTCNGALDRAPVPTLYAQARGVAEAALDGYVMAEVGTATHYHTADIDPWWRPTLMRIAQVGAHVFYGWTRPSGGSDHIFQHYGGGELSLPQAVIDGRVSRRVQDGEAPPPPVEAAARIGGPGVDQGTPRGGRDPVPPQPTIAAVPS